MSGRLGGKVALVTGASRGIGRATALAFAREGAAVVVNYSKSHERARRVVDEIRSADGQAVAIQADVARKAGVPAMVERALGRSGKIDVPAGSRWSRRAPRRPRRARSGRRGRRT